MFHFCPNHNALDDCHDNKPPDMRGSHPTDILQLSGIHQPVFEYARRLIFSNIVPHDFTSATRQPRY
jgi:hypothetical protein